MTLPTDMQALFAGLAVGAIAVAIGAVVIWAGGRK
jgi:hypothetical protein